MACTTILVGKKASYDGSTMIARNDDSGAGHYTPKKFAVIKPEELSTSYETVLSHCKVELPKDGMRITAMPNAVDGLGIWAACGVNSAQVAMTATETITSNPRVQGADPLVKYKKATATEPEQAGGIGEEDFLYITLPYIHSAREGVQRLGKLLETYGTYEMNGIAFSDNAEIWWLETIGGHHWIAKRVLDDVYVVMPNQLGLDSFDLADALGDQKDHMCSADMRTFIEENHLDLSLDENGGMINPRLAFGSHDDSDHVYNTPRAWYMLKTLNPHTYNWDGPDADFTPASDDLPWCMVPEQKLTPEDVKYALSSHYQGTQYDPYSIKMKGEKPAFRPVGVNRTDFMGFVQLRPDTSKEDSAIEWITFASNVFNAMIPLYADVDHAPAYLNSTTETVSTDSFYWTSRMIGALTDAAYGNAINHIEHYQSAVHSQGHAIIRKYDKLLADIKDAGEKLACREKANQEIADMVERESKKTLLAVLDEASNIMRNSFSRNDA